MRSCSVEGDEGAGDVPRRAACLGQQHQRQQAGHLDVVGHQLAQHPGEPDRLHAQVAADRAVAARHQVALVEDEVDDGEHPRTAGGQVGGLGHPVRDASASLIFFFARVRRCASVVSGTRNAAGDLGHGQPGDEAQGQRDPGLGGEGRVAAGEHQPEAIVLDRAGVLGGGVRLVPAAFGFMVACRCLSSRRASRRIRSMALLPAVVVSHPPGLGGTPSTGHFSTAASERLAGRLLGDVEITEAAGQRRDDPRVLLAEDALDLESSRCRL